ncbi:hypothetical protein MTR67_023862 [Solanum verrucosum]|uniref:Uncharacterized protein n=1 Tax=Solanum verrucosum TaxID=315347 RepID=A0AAF0QUC9_SOLVR|nr:hypothetical protein MTR67_023862 [Solanum verrucosum]
MINFLRSSKNYMFCFCSSAVISSRPLAHSPRSRLTLETVDKRYQRFFSEECRSV